MTAVVNNRTVVFFVTALALAPLEILNAVCAVSNSLNCRKLLHSGLGKLVYIVPVDERRSALHHKERLTVFHRAERIVNKSCFGRFFCVSAFIPCGVVIPRNEVELLCEFLIIDAVIHLHKIGCDGNVGSYFAKRRNFVFVERNMAIGNKSVPAELHCGNMVFASVFWGIDLTPIGHSVAPETVPPAFVKLFKVIMIIIPEPIPESFLTKLTMAFTAVFVGNVPHLEGGMVLIALCYDAVDFTHLFSVNRRSEAMIVAHAEFVADAVFFNSEHLGIFLRKPRGPCARGCCKDNGNAVFMELVHHCVQPAEIIDTFFGLDKRPRKDVDCCTVDVGELHQSHVLVPDFGGFYPLVGVIVSAVDDKIKKFLFHVLLLNAVSINQCVIFFFADRNNGAVAGSEVIYGIG